MARIIPIILLAFIAGTAAVLVEDPLIGSSTGRVQGGQFVTDGWGAVTNSDYIHYAIQGQMTKGTVIFEIKGIKVPVSGDARKHFWQIFEKNETTSEASNNFIMLRLYTNTKDAHKPGEVRFRMNGPDFGKRQGETQHQWDPAKWYKVRISWTGTRSTWYKDGATQTSLSYPGANVSLNHMYINGGKMYEGFPGLSGVVFRNVIVSDDPNFAGITGIRKSEIKMQPGLNVSPNPFSGSTVIKVEGNGNGKRRNINLKIYNINGKMVKDLSSIYLLPSTLYLQAAGLSPGIYLAKLIFGNRQYAEKLVLFQ